MKGLAKALIVMMAISGLAFMGCDNGTTNGGGGGSGNGPGNRVIAEQYRGTFRVTTGTGVNALTTTIVLGENTVTRTSVSHDLTPQTTNYPPFPAWTEGNRLYGRVSLEDPNFVAHIGTFTNVDTLSGQGFALGTHIYIRVPQE